MDALFLRLLIFYYIEGYTKNAQKASEMLSSQISGGYDSHCDSFKVNREEEDVEGEEETFSFLKSSETKGGCWHECVLLWHQATILVSNPNRFASPLKSDYFPLQKYKKLSRMPQSSSKRKKK